MTRIREQDLILPALYIISNNPKITTSGLILELRGVLKPTGEDAEILAGRSDDKFSQIVRNLVSHHTLDQRYIFTTLTPIGNQNSSHVITKKGEMYLYENFDSFQNLLSNNFDYVTTIEGIREIGYSHRKRQKAYVFDENLLITEGKKKTVTTQIYARSQQLRDKAIEIYSLNGRIKCQACGFDFFEIYGEIGKGFIEIHHQKPIFQYEDEDFAHTLAEAVKQVIPVCSNCHRMIHRSKEAPISINDLKKIFDQNNREN